MANLGEIEAAIAALEQVGSNRHQITLLHCTTEYPAPVEEVNAKRCDNGTIFWCSDRIL